MSSYRPLSVAEAGPIMAPKIGLTWEDNRNEVVTYLNRYRNLLYNRYEDQRLFDNVFHCICPSRFHNECTSCNPCDRCYLGFSLPRDMAGVVQAWSWNRPLTLRSSWREAFTGRAPTNGDHCDVVEVRENFPTERDLKVSSTLQVYGESLADAGQKVVIEVTNTDNQFKKLAFELPGDGAVTLPMVVRKIHNVVLPQNLCGAIILSAGDYELSRYSPTEKVPAYKRYKLPGICRSNVLVQGTRQLVEVYFDQDVIEIGDRMVLEFMGTYFKYYESSSNSESTKADNALKNAYKNLDGLVSRDDGGKLPQPTLHKHPKQSLPGYRKYYRGIPTL